jgi:hypothetical protein
MSALTRMFRRRRGAKDPLERGTAAQAAPVDEPAPIDIAPNDPLLAYLQSASGAVDIQALELDSTRRRWPSSRPPGSSSPSRSSARAS